MLKGPIDAISSITNYQVNKILGLVENAVSNSSGFFKEPLAQVLKNERKEMVADILKVLHTHVANNINHIIRKVTIDNSVKPEKLIELITPNVNYSHSALSSMSSKIKGEVELVFFRVPQQVYSDSVYVDMCRELNVVPNPYAVAQYNIDDPGFAKIFPNGTHWMNSRKEYNHIEISYDSEGNMNKVIVSGTDLGDGLQSCRYDHFWFGGIRK